MSFRITPCRIIPKTEVLNILYILLLQIATRIYNTYQLRKVLFFYPKQEEKVNKQYIYPQNMRASATLWLWSLKDFAIIVVGALFSAMVLATTKILIPAVLTAAFAFLSIRNDETTILDFIKYAVRYFISTQQIYYWKVRGDKN